MIETLISTREALRGATRDIHVATEKRWLPHGVFEDLEGYLAWLSALAAIHAGRGAAAAKRLDQAWITDEEDKRYIAIVADLGHQSLDKTVEQKMNTSEAWGVLYVLNGSALGAVSLLRSDALSPQWPKAYLNQMKSFASSGLLKRFFCELEAAPIDTNAAIKGAKATFAAIGDHM